MLNFRASLGVFRAVAVGVAAFLLSGTAAVAQHFPAFQQAVAEGVSGNPGLSEFYRTAKYDDLWTGADDAARRTAFLTALTRAPEHGLPVQRYDVPGLMAAFDTVQSERDRGKLESRMSQTFVQFATDLHSGVLDPSRLDAAIVRELPRPDVAQLMTDFATAPAGAFIRNLAPSAPEYARLFRSKRELEAAIAQGGWGPSVPQVRFAPGSSGPACHFHVLLKPSARHGIPGTEAGSAAYDPGCVANRCRQRFRVNLVISEPGRDRRGRGPSARLNGSPARAVCAFCHRGRFGSVNTLDVIIPRWSRPHVCGQPDGFFYARYCRQRHSLRSRPKAIVGCALVMC